MYSANMKGDGLHEVGGEEGGILDWPDPPNRKLLIHFEEDAPFVDDGDTGHTITTVGAVTADAGDAKWGSKSGLFAGGQLTIPDGPNFQFGTDPWGWEAQVKPNALTGDKVMFGLGTGVNDRFIIYSGVGASYLAWYWIKSGAGGTGVCDPGMGWAAGVWSHLAYQRLDAYRGIVFLNGVPVMIHLHNQSATYTPGLIRIGAQYSGSQFLGRQDEVLVWTGPRLEARVYNPPTGPYP
jgi:hypothetical protein